MLVRGLSVTNVSGWLRDDIGLCGTPCNDAVASRPSDRANAAAMAVLGLEPVLRGEAYMLSDDTIASLGKVCE